MSEFEKLLKEYRDLKISPTKETFEKLKMEYVYYSNKLEGSNLTLIQTIDVIRNHKTSGEASIEDTIMAIDHYRALNSAITFGSNKYPLSEKILLSLHETLLRNSFNVDPFYQSWIDSGQQLGNYKVKANRIETTINGSKELFLTPTPEESKGLIQKSIELYLNSSNEFLDRLSKLVQNIYNAHAFFDGNKRMTRLVIANLLLANGIPLMLPHANYNDYNEALIKGFVNNESNSIKTVLEQGFNQYLASEIETHKKAKNPNRGGFGLIV